MGRQVHQQPHQQRHQHCRQQHSQQQQPTPVGKWKTWMALWHLNVSVSLWQHALFGAHLVSYLFKSFMMGFPLGASPKQKQWPVDASPTIQARPTLIVRFFMFQSLLALPFEEAGRLFNMYLHDFFHNTSEVRDSEIRRIYGDNEHLQFFDGQFWIIPMFPLGLILEPPRIIVTDYFCDLLYLSALAWASR